ncbi:MAG: glycosyltransferase family 4 protein [Actinomycetota bacterium]|nr:glycosyltransferase family 4 protein [Actinomycetota bacterium]
MPTESSAAPLRAVIDARPALERQRTGVGHYTDQLLRRLPAADPQSAYIAWYLDARGSHRGTFTGIAPNLTEAVSRFPARVFGRLSSRAGWPRVESRSGRFDVLLATNFLPPQTRSRGVVLVVHDLAFEVLPDTAPHVNERFRDHLRRWLQRAAGTIVPSVSARDDLIRLHDVDPARIEVVHHGADARSRPAPPEAVADVRRRFGIAEGPFILFVGGIEPRKNLERLVRAFGASVTRDGEAAGASFVIAGGAVPWFPSAGERVDAAIAGLPAAARGRVIRTGYVDENDRDALLAGAVALAYPSLYEGFGFPVLEAFAAGLPVLTSNVSSLPEVAGDAALLVDPLDESAISHGLSALLGDPAAREQLAQAGRERVAMFSWEACAKGTAEVLHKAHAWAQG